MLPEWLESELDTVPDFDAFAGAEELARLLEAVAAAHPDVATLRVVGESRQGEPLLCLTIGSPGPAEALVFGLPHPNEPIGGLTAVHLARRLCADAQLRARLGHRWHVIACIDPDGLRLNEGWLRGPFTREHYARHFYRPAGRDQIEWTFPLDYKDAHFDTPLPETRALMRLIDEHRPELVCSLHNSELGGVYYYLSRTEPALYPILQEVPERLGLPLHRGEPEAPHIVRYADGVYRVGSIRRAYDRMAEQGQLWSGDSGDNTASYASRHGALTLISELPYWIDPTADDETPTGTSYAEALAGKAAAVAELAEVLQRGLDAVQADLVTPDSPYWRATRFFAGLMARTAESTAARARLPESDRPATVAEVTTLAGDGHSFQLRYGGILLRGLDDELAAGNRAEPIARTRARTAARYERWLAADPASAYAVIPIRSLVATQYAATVATAAHLAGPCGRGASRAE
ncbi:M14 family zinc carboxypeptidase [Nonomuraea zeae]|uniref:M14 family zinc carboxypeptidase n=1 Tax=Nonomuraea zeae TaxID=1642303 RepID=UPI001F0DCADE|nr:M14 family zinc carboxypeptidase [Nonomuraea zeae]